VDALESGRQRLCGLPQAEILSGIEGEVSLDETNEIAARSKPEHVLVVANPTVEFRADEVEILRCGAAFALANALGVLASQPRLDSVGVFVFPEVLELCDLGLPDLAGSGAASNRRCWPVSGL